MFISLLSCCSTCSAGHVEESFKPTSYGHYPFKISFDQIRFPTHQYFPLLSGQFPSKPPELKNPDEEL